MNKHKADIMIGVFLTCIVIALIGQGLYSLTSRETDRYRELSQKWYQAVHICAEHNRILRQQLDDRQNLCVDIIQQIAC